MLFCLNCIELLYFKKITAFYGDRHCAIFLTSSCRPLIIFIVRIIIKKKCNFFPENFFYRTFSNGLPAFTAGNKNNSIFKIINLRPGNNWIAHSKIINTRYCFGALLKFNGINRFFLAIVAPEYSRGFL